MIKKEFLPEGYEFTTIGLKKFSKKMTRKLANAYPHVWEVKEVEDGTGKRQVYVYIGYWIVERKEVIGNEQISFDKILEGKFVKCLPPEVIIEPGAEKSVKEVFRYCIQRQMEEISVTKEYRFGWAERKFCMGVPATPCKEPLAEEEYEVAGEQVRLLMHSQGNVVRGALLARYHGVLERPLIKAGISHDFVTYFLGETGIGKTDVAKKVCTIAGAGEQILAVISDRKEIKRLLGTMQDMTVVFDDYCSTGSNRVSEKQKQTISEIIQTASDAGRDITDASDVKQERGCNHIVITAEELISNLSTVNRLFLVNMDEPLPEDLYALLEKNSEGLMDKFMSNLLFRIGEKWDEAVSRIRVDYAIFFGEAKKRCKEAGNSANRIAGTMAVQQTIWKVIKDYLRSLGIDEEMVKNADQMMQNTINTGIRDLVEEVKRIQGEKNYKRYLPEMARIVRHENNRYFLVESEKEYKKYRNEPCGKGVCIGICREDGYWSCIPKDLCKILSEEMGEDVSVMKVSKELKHFGLAHIDSEEKLSNRWRTEGKMYHIRVSDLYEVTGMPSQSFPYNDLYESYQWYCKVQDYIGDDGYETENIDDGSFDNENEYCDNEE